MRTFVQIESFGGLKIANKNTALTLCILSYGFFAVLEHTDATLFRNKKFILNVMLKRNASKFAIFLEYENPCSFFIFHFVLLYFSPNECPGLCRAIARNEKMEKITLGFLI